MFKNNKLMKAVLMLVTLCWFGSVYASGNNIAISELPEAVVKSAENAVQGIVLREAERKDRDGRVVYEVEGFANNTKYELKIDSDGKVLTIEEDD